MTNFNERTNTLLYKNVISHTLFSKGWWLLCVRSELETEQTAILTQSSSDHSSTSFESWLAAQPWVTEGCETLRLQAGSHAGILSPIDSNSLAPGYIIVYVHLLPLFFRLFTQVHSLYWRLGRGSIYNTGTGLKLNFVLKLLRLPYIPSRLVFRNIRQLIQSHKWRTH